MSWIKPGRKEQLFASLLLSVVLAIALPASLLAQKHSLGLELQVYPTGLIPGLTYEQALAGRPWTFSLRLAGNFFDHKDFGVQLSERGKGIGLSPGWNVYLHPFFSRSLFFGLRSDFWRNFVQWENITSNGVLVAGETRLLVVQPTALVGYRWAGSGWKFALTAALGFEINVLTQGEPTGQGAIFLLGFVFALK